MPGSIYDKPEKFSFEYCTESGDERVVHAKAYDVDAGRTLNGYVVELSPPLRGGFLEKAVVLGALLFDFNEGKTHASIAVLPYESVRSVDGKPYDLPPSPEARCREFLEAIYATETPAVAEA